MIFLPGGDEFDEIAAFQRAVDNFIVGYDTTEWVEHRVEDQSLQRSFGVAFRSRDSADDGVEYLRYALPCLSTGADYVGAVTTKKIHNLILHFFRFGTVKVYLVDHGDYLKIIVDGHVEIGYRLSLNALRGIYNQQRTLACRYRT